jgi:DNA-binding MarR family transcriptional regulator
MVSGDYELLQRVGLLFRSVNINFRDAIESALRERGVELSFAHVSTLSILGANPGINGAQLARLSLVSPQAMTSVLKLLADRKLVERRPHPDSLRADSWTLTARGEKLLERGREAFEIVTSQMLSGLSAQEIIRLERFLRECAQALESPAPARRGAAG